MKTPKWTKADASRAEKMGWRLVNYTGDDHELPYTAITQHGDRFKSDDEAIEWVLNASASWYVEHGLDGADLLKVKTCRKALFLCAKG